MLAAQNANIIILSAPTAGHLRGFAQERSLHAGAAVRFHELRRTIPQIAIAGLLATAAGCVAAVIDTDCIDTVDRTYHIDTPAELSVQFSIDRCRIDVDACKDLCRQALAQNHVTIMPSRCEVSFESSAVDVSVSYETTTDGDGCPVENLSPRDLASPADLSSAVPGLPDGPQVRGLDARTFDTIWNGGRTCHA